MKNNDRKPKSRDKDPYDISNNYSIRVKETSITPEKESLLERIGKVKNMVWDNFEGLSAADAESKRNHAEQMLKSAQANYDETIKSLKEETEMLQELDNCKTDAELNNWLINNISKLK